VISFTSRVFYPKGNVPIYPLDKRLAESKFQPTLFGEETSRMPVQGIEALYFGCRRLLENV